MAKKPPLKPVVTVTIHGAGEFSSDLKRSVGSWLREQSFLLDKFASKYSKQYRARYFLHEGRR